MRRSRRQAGKQNVEIAREVTLRLHRRVRIAREAVHPEVEHHERRHRDALDVIPVDSTKLSRIDSALEQAPDLIVLQRDLKRVFDPQGLLNPGKIFPAGSHRAC